MTASDAAALVVDLVRTLSATRADLANAHADRDAYRLLAQHAIAYAARLQRDLAGIEARYHRLLDDRRDEPRAAEAA